MTDSKNRQWILNARPAGKLTGAEFLWNEAPIPRPCDGQVLIGLCGCRSTRRSASGWRAIPTSPRFRLGMSCSPLRSGR